MNWSKRKKIKPLFIVNINEKNTTMTDDDMNDLGGDIVDEAKVNVSIAHSSDKKCADNASVDNASVATQGPHIRSQSHAKVYPQSITVIKSQTKTSAKPNSKMAFMTRPNKTRDNVTPIERQVQEPTLEIISLSETKILNT